MSGTSNSKLSDEERNGIKHNHAYSVLGLYYEKDKNGYSIQLVKVRNPWGHGEWEGPWSDNSADWYPEIEERLGKTSANDGTFFMPLKDYYHCFRTTAICYEHGCTSEHNQIASIEHNFAEVKDSASKHEMENNAAKHFVFFEMDVPQNIDLKHDDFTVQVMQQGNRVRFGRHPDPEKKFEMSHCNVAICSGSCINKSLIEKWNPAL